MPGQTEETRSNIKELLAAASEYLDLGGRDTRMRLMQAVAAFRPTPIEDARDLLISSGRFVLANGVDKTIVIGDGIRNIGLLRVP